jgi:hypothetical protein
VDKDGSFVHEEDGEPYYPGVDKGAEATKELKEHLDEFHGGAADREDEFKGKATPKVGDSFTVKGEPQGHGVLDAGPRQVRPLQGRKGMAGIGSGVGLATRSPDGFPSPALEFHWTPQWGA